MGACLDELSPAGDASADAVIGELARTQQIRAVSRILRQLVDNDQPVPDELPPSIALWLRETAELPAWVDHDRFERGCAMVVEHGPQVCVVLGTAALVYYYAGYPGVKVLTFSRRLDHDAVLELERSWTASGVFPAIDNALVQTGKAQPA